MRKISSSKEIHGKNEFSAFDSLSKNRFVSMKKKCVTGRCQLNFKRVDIFHDGHLTFHFAG